MSQTTTCRDDVTLNAFELKLKESGHYPLKAKRFNVLEANVGYKCNLSCTHCYVEASPERTEEMPLSTINRILDILRDNKEITTLDITGGAPELNSHYKYFVKSAVDTGKKVMVRSNLAIFAEPAMKDIPEFLAENRVKIIASLPCVTEEGVDKQRGRGTYRKIIPVLKKLNGLGYGGEGTSPELDLVFNPGSASLAPEQQMLERVYKDKLKEMHGIVFNHLIALPNQPGGRLRKSMSADEIKTYEQELEEKFNPDALENVMCRHIINISYDGSLYDCECAQMAGLQVGREVSTLENFDYERLAGREIITMPYCFICTAGAGTTCLPSNASKAGSSCRGG